MGKLQTAIKNWVAPSLLDVEDSSEVEDILNDDPYAIVRLYSDKSEFRNSLDCIILGGDYDGDENVQEAIEDFYNNHSLSSMVSLLYKSFGRDVPEEPESSYNDEDIY